MLKNFSYRIKKVVELIVKMADNLPSASSPSILEQEDKGSKRPADDGNTDQSKRQKIIGADGNRLPKRKIALLIGYNGKNYYGLQLNKDVPTIEHEILTALKEVECIPQDHFDVPQKMNFMRACRTDKGVSAICNLLSLKMVTSKENLIEEVNSKLPPQIKVYGYFKTTKGFNCKHACDNRTYDYICPTYAFAPIDNIVTDEYRMTDDVLNRINEVLRKFVGTHKFHNYTSQIQSTDNSARRYIISFTCGKPFMRDGCEFCVLTVKGQSFMLNQIRKMVGMTIAIVRGNCGVEVIDKTWEAGRVDVPKAPALGLCLDRPHYDSYNRRYGDDGIHDCLDWSKFQTEIEKFKEEYIYSDIMQTEKEQKVMMEWLGDLQYHEFDVVDDQEKRRPRFGIRDTLKNCKNNPDIVISPESKMKQVGDNLKGIENVECKEDNSMDCKGDNKEDCSKSEPNVITESVPGNDMQTHPEKETVSGQS